MKVFCCGKKHNFYNILNTHTQDTSLRDNSNLLNSKLPTQPQKKKKNPKPHKTSKTLPKIKKIKKNIKKIKLIKE